MTKPCERGLARTHHDVVVDENIHPVEFDFLRHVGKQAAHLKAIISTKSA
jgi:hypothetical protein